MTPGHSAKEASLHSDPQRKRAKGTRKRRPAHGSSSLDKEAASIRQEASRNEGTMIAQHTGDVYISQGIDRASKKARRSKMEQEEQIQGIPYQPSKNFIGRERILQKMKDVFAHSGDELSQKIFVIVGLGGTGKSEICVKFAAVNTEQYVTTYWIDATNHASIERGYERIGRSLGLTDCTKDAVRRRLGFNDKRTLLIMDNADDPCVDYSEALPCDRKVDVIMSTRMKDLAHEYQSVGFEKLEQLSADEACRLLILTAGLSHTRGNEEKGLEIVRELGCHTLAIVHAGAYIRRTRSLDTYLESYTSDPARFLRQEKVQNASRYRSVFATFEISATHIRALANNDCAAADDALSLLDILAIAPPEMNVKNVFQKLCTIAAHQAKLMSDALPSKIWKIVNSRIEKDPSAKFEWLSWVDAMAFLEDYAIVSLCENGHVLIHSLVRTWAWERQSASSKLQSWSAVASALMWTKPFTASEACNTCLWRSCPLVTPEQRKWALRQYSVTEELIDSYPARLLEDMMDASNEIIIDGIICSPKLAHLQAELHSVSLMVAGLKGLPERGLVSLQEYTVTSAHNAGPMEKIADLQLVDAARRIIARHKSVQQARSLAEQCSSSKCSPSLTQLLLIGTGFLREIGSDNVARKDADILSGLVGRSYLDGYPSDEASAHMKIRILGLLAAIFVMSGQKGQAIRCAAKIGRIKNHRRQPRAFFRAMINLEFTEYYLNRALNLILLEIKEDIVYGDKDRVRASNREKTAAGECLILR